MPDSLSYYLLVLPSSREGADKACAIHSLSGWCVTCYAAHLHCHFWASPHGQSPMLASSTHNSTSMQEPYRLFLLHQLAVVSHDCGANVSSSIQVRCLLVCAVAAAAAAAARVGHWMIYMHIKSHRMNLIGNFLTDLTRVTAYCCVLLSMHGIWRASCPAYLQHV